MAENTEEYTRIRTYTKTLDEKNDDGSFKTLEVNVDLCPIHGEFEYPNLGPFTFSHCPQCCEEKNREHEQEEEKRKLEAARQRAIKTAERMQDPAELERMGIGKSFYAARLDDWIPEANEPFRSMQEKAKFGVIEAAKRRSGTVLLLGGHGTRKTTLVIAAMRFMGEGFITTMFDCSFRLRTEGGGSPDLLTGYRFLCFLREVPVLCIDETGLTSCSDYDVQWFSEVINARKAGMLLTYIIGNYPTRSLAPKGYKGIIFDDMVGHAVMSRLSDAEIYRVSGKDFREEAKSPDTAGCMEER